MVNSESMDSTGDGKPKDYITQLNSGGGGGGGGTGISAESHSPSPVTASSVRLRDMDYDANESADVTSASECANPADTLPETAVHTCPAVDDENFRLTTTTTIATSQTTDGDVSSLFCSVPLNKVQDVLVGTYSSTVDPPTQQQQCGDGSDAKHKKLLTRKLLCLYCDRTFVTSNLRQKHVDRCHSVKQARRSSSRFQSRFTTTVCKFCKKLNNADHSLDDLFKHLVEKHSSKYFACVACQERFVFKTHLEEHNLRHHERKEEIASSTGKEEEASDIYDDRRNDPVAEDSRLGIETVKTKHKTKIKKYSELHEENMTLNRPNLRMSVRKELRKKKVGVKSTKTGVKRNTRLQTKVTNAQTKSPTKKRIKTRNEKNSESAEKSSSSCVNPYPTFDAYFRVKKITDHSIDNLKISSLTFDDVFDKAFYTRIKCNIQENLQNHIDGKLFKNEESESRISNFEKNQELNSSPAENFGCDISLNAATPVVSLLSSQLGEDLESQIEYGAKASKKKPPPKKDEVHYKYFTRRKYQASILENKENRDLSKLDMWTQLVVKDRQQKIINDKKTEKEKLEYTKGIEYRTKMQNAELNRILDRRGPFEDLKEEANKKAALEKYNRLGENVSCEAISDVSSILNDLIEGVFDFKENSIKTEDDEKTPEQTKLQLSDKDCEIPFYLNLRRNSSLIDQPDIDKSDRITLICSSQETENYEEFATPRDKNTLVELTGEWTRTRIYICAACGVKVSNMKLLLDHKSIYHQNVWVQHYEFVGNQSVLYRHLSIPGLGKVGYVEEFPVSKSWKRSDARLCTKCSRMCNTLGELHRHILECGEDWSWMLARRKLKYRPFGAKSRRKRRGLVKRIIHKEKSGDEVREKRKYNVKRYDGPRPKPSDAETIQRMLANLPAKRATRKLISLKDGFPKQVRRKVAQKTPNNPSNNGGKKIVTTKQQKTSVSSLKNQPMRGRKRKKKGLKCNPMILRKSMRNINKVFSSKILDRNAALMVKRKMKNALQHQRITRARKGLIEEPKDEAEASAKKDGFVNKVKMLTRAVKKTVLRNKEDKSDNSTSVNNSANVNKTSARCTRNLKKSDSLDDTIQDIIDSLDAAGKQSDKSKINDEDGDAPKTEVSKKKPKLMRKESVGTKLVRQLSLRKLRKKDENDEESAQKTQSNPELNVKRNEDKSKNGKRKSSLDSFRNKIKKIKLKEKNITQIVQVDGSSQISDEILPFLEKINISSDENQDKIEAAETTNPDPDVDPLSVTDEVLPQEKIEEPVIIEDVTDDNTEQNLPKLPLDEVQTPQAQDVEKNEDKDDLVDGVISDNLEAQEIETKTSIELPICSIEPVEAPDPTPISDEPIDLKICSNKNKTKSKKRSKGLNDCIAMLTSKLQQKVDEEQPVEAPPPPIIVKEPIMEKIVAEEKVEAPKQPEPQKIEKNAFPFAHIPFIDHLAQQRLMEMNRKIIDRDHIERQRHELFNLQARLIAEQQQLFLQQLHKQIPPAHPYGYIPNIPRETNFLINTIMLNSQNEFIQKLLHTNQTEEGLAKFLGNLDNRNNRFKEVDVNIEIDIMKYLGNVADNGVKLEKVKNKNEGKKKSNNSRRYNNKRKENIEMINDLKQRELLHKILNGSNELNSSFIEPEIELKQKKFDLMKDNDKVMDLKVKKIEEAQILKLPEIPPKIIEVGQMRSIEIANELNKVIDLKVKKNCEKERQANLLEQLSKNGVSIALFPCAQNKCETFSGNNNEIINLKIPKTTEIINTIINDNNKNELINENIPTFTIDKGIIRSEVTNEMLPFTPQSQIVIPEVKSAKKTEKKKRGRPAKPKIEVGQIPEPKPVQDDVINLKIPKAETKLNDFNLNANIPPFSQIDLKLFDTLNTSFVDNTKMHLNPDKNQKIKDKLEIFPANTLNIIRPPIEDNQKDKQEQEAAPKEKKKIILKPPQFIATSLEKYPIIENPILPKVPTIAESLSFSIPEPTNKIPKKKNCKIKNLDSIELKIKSLLLEEREPDIMEEKSIANFDKIESNQIETAIPPPSTKSDTDSDDDIPLANLINQKKQDQIEAPIDVIPEIEPPEDLPILEKETMPILEEIPPERGEEEIPIPYLEKEVPETAISPVDTDIPAPILEREPPQLIQNEAPDALNDLIDAKNKKGGGRKKRVNPPEKAPKKKTPKCKGTPLYDETEVDPLNKAARKIRISCQIFQRSSKIVLDKSALEEAQEDEEEEEKIPRQQEPLKPMELPLPDVFIKEELSTEVAPLPLNNSAELLSNIKEELPEVEEAESEPIPVPPVEDFFPPQLEETPSLTAEDLELEIRRRIKLSNLQLKRETVDDNEAIPTSINTDIIYNVDSPEEMPPEEDQDISEAGFELAQDETDSFNFEIEKEMAQLMNSEISSAPPTLDLSKISSCDILSNIETSSLDENNLKMCPENLVEETTNLIENSQNIDEENLTEMNFDVEHEKQGDLPMEAANTAPNIEVLKEHKPQEVKSKKIKKKHELATTDIIPTYGEFEVNTNQSDGVNKITISRKKLPVNTDEDDAQINNGIDLYVVKKVKRSRKKSVGSKEKKRKKSLALLEENKTIEDNIIENISTLATNLLDVRNNFEDNFLDNIEFEVQNEEIGRKLKINKKKPKTPPPPPETPIPETETEEINDEQKDYDDLPKDMEIEEFQVDIPIIETPQFPPNIILDEIPVKIAATPEESVISAVESGEMSQQHPDCSLVDIANKKSVGNVEIESIASQPACQEIDNSFFSCNLKEIYDASLREKEKLESMNSSCDSFLQLGAAPDISAAAIENEVNSEKELRNFSPAVLNDSSSVTRRMEEFQPASNDADDEIDPLNLSEKQRKSSKKMKNLPDPINSDLITSEDKPTVKKGKKSKKAAQKDEEPSAFDMMCDELQALCDAPLELRPLVEEKSEEKDLTSIDDDLDFLNASSSSFCDNLKSSCDAKIDELLREINFTPKPSKKPKKLKASTPKPEVEIEEKIDEVQDAPEEDLFENLPNESPIKPKLNKTKLSRKKSAKSKKERSISIDNVELYCDICDKMFARSENLVKHKRTLTHIAKLSEIEAKEAQQAKEAKQLEEISESPPQEEEQQQSFKMDINISDILNNSEKHSDQSDLTNDIASKIHVNSPFVLKTNSDTLKLADIINDVLNKPVENEKHATYSDSHLNQTNSVTKGETKRYKSLGERKSFESDLKTTYPFNTLPVNTDPIPKLPNTDPILKQQISILENIIETEGPFGFIDDITVSSNKSIGEEPLTKSPSELSILSETKQDDSNQLSFSHNANIISDLAKPNIHTEPFIKPPTQYEEISNDSSSVRNQFDDQRSRKVLNRDEELFLECCSLLKSSSEVSGYSKRSSKTVHIFNNFEMKQSDEPDWLEKKTFTAKNPDLFSNSCPNTPLGDGYGDDCSNTNSNTIATDWSTKQREQQQQENPVFEDISLDSKGSTSSKQENLQFKAGEQRTFSDFQLFNAEHAKVNEAVEAGCNVSSLPPPQEENIDDTEVDEDFKKKMVSRFGGLMAKAWKNSVQVVKKNKNKKKQDSEVTQTSITDYAIPIIITTPKSDKDATDSKKMLTKGAMKVFEGLKVSIPTDDLNMKELLNGSHSAKKHEEAEPAEPPPPAEMPPKESDPPKDDIKVPKPNNNNLKSFGNRLGLKVTKKKYNIAKATEQHPSVIKSGKIEDDGKKTHDVYDFEETQDNTDMFSSKLTNIKEFRNQIAGKKNLTEVVANKEVNAAEDGEESDTDDPRGAIDSFSFEAKSLSSFSTESNSSIKKPPKKKNITKKKCMIMGRIFKNAFKSKADEDIRDIPSVDNSKLVEDYVLHLPQKEEKRTKLTEQEMDLLFNKLLEDKPVNEDANQKKPETPIVAPVAEIKVVEKSTPSISKAKSKNPPKRKRQRHNSESTDDEFSLNKNKKRYSKKKQKNVDNAINLEQELKECIGVASRKSQRKCTSGKQNVLVEFWSSDDSNFEAFIRETAIDKSSPTKLDERDLTKDEIDGEKREPNVEELFQDLENTIKKATPKIEIEPQPKPCEKSANIHHAPKPNKIANLKQGRRKSSNAKHRVKLDEDVEDKKMKNIKVTAETLATNRRKRAASNTLYYWSSSSEDESQDLIEVKPVRDEIDEDEDRPMQHGWIVGDSPKKLVTMLAQAKGKKLDADSVKEQGKKRTTM